MVEQILQAGDPKLTIENRDLNFKTDRPYIISVFDRMKTVMKENPFVGLAAPQIGENINLFITEIRKTKYRTDLNEIDPLRIYINPKITYYSKELVVMTEGCGSVDYGKTRFDISRPKDIVIVYFDIDGNEVKEKVYKLRSRVIQHEYDHLQGKLITSDEFKNEKHQ